MKILIELPTWLGDAVMTTPTIENLVAHYNNPEITLIGSFVALELFRYHPYVINSIVLEKKYTKIYKLTKKLDKFDVFISFRSSFRSKILKLFISSNNKYQFKKNTNIERHQVERYTDFINISLGTTFKPKELKIYRKSKSNKFKNTLIAGINPGASYGNAKRWYPKEFSEVIEKISKDYKVIIFGGPSEILIAKEIENQLIKNGVRNFKNLAGKTSVEELIEYIANLNLFISNDSGPMHIAASFQIPTVAIFGPTRDKETSPWMNKNSEIVKKNLNCQPCMKRTCHLKHHNCMKQIKSVDVLIAIDSIT